MRWLIAGLVLASLGACTGPAGRFDESANEGLVRTHVTVMGHETEFQPTVGLVDLDPEGQCTSPECAMTIGDGGLYDLDRGRWRLVPLQDQRLGIAPPVEVTIEEDETVDASFDYTGPEYDGVSQMIRKVGKRECTRITVLRNDDRIQHANCQLRPGLAAAFVVGPGTERPPHLVGVYGRNWFVYVRDAAFAKAVHQTLGGVRMRP